MVLKGKNIRQLTEAIIPCRKIFFVGTRIRRIYTPAYRLSRAGIFYLQRFFSNRKGRKEYDSKISSVSQRRKENEGRKTSLFPLFLRGIYLVGKKSATSLRFLCAKLCALCG